MEKITRLLFILFINMSALAQPNIVKDSEGNEYKTVQIGNQVWMAENLRTSVYGNGDSISNIINKEKWISLQSGAWSHYQNDEEYNPIYGKLYNWYVIEDGGPSFTGLSSTLPFRQGRSSLSRSVEHTFQLGFFRSESVGYRDCGSGVRGHGATPTS